MSHPTNKHERIEIGKNKGVRRIKAEISPWPPKTKTQYLDEIEKRSRYRRDTGKLCSCDMCCNPRKSPWNKNKEKLTMQERKELEKLGL